MNVYNYTALGSSSLLKNYFDFPLLALSVYGPFIISATPFGLLFNLTFDILNNFIFFFVFATD